MAEYLELEFENNDLFKGEINTLTGDFFGGPAMYLNNKTKTLIVGSLSKGGLFEGYCAAFDFS